MEPSTVVGIQHITAIGVTGVAAYTDVRTGKIPNWLTYPVLVAGPLLFWIAAEKDGLWRCGLGLLACGIIPFLMWRSGGMGGGEVKLLAGLGALTGAFVGIEIEFYAMAAGCVAALLMLARQRRLLAALGNLFFLFMNPIMPKKWRREVQAELKHEIRIGPAILVGTLIAVGLQHPGWVGLGQ